MFLSLSTTTTKKYKYTLIYPFQVEELSRQMDDTIWIVLLAVLMIVVVVLSYATWRGNKCCKEESRHRYQKENAKYEAKQANQRYASQNRERNQLKFENDVLMKQYENMKNQYEKLMIDNHQLRNNYNDMNNDQSLP